MKWLTVHDGKMEIINAEHRPEASVTGSLKKRIIIGVYLTDEGLQAAIEMESRRHPNWVRP